jgi:hypothetical protein
VSQGVELRSAASGSGRTIGGMAAVFNSPSENLGGFVERVGYRAFDQSRANGFAGCPRRVAPHRVWRRGSAHDGGGRADMCCSAGGFRHVPCLGALPRLALD